MKPASFEHDLGDFLGTESAIPMRMHNCASRHEEPILPIAGVNVRSEVERREANVGGDEIAWMAGSGNVNVGIRRGKRGSLLRFRAQTDEKGVGRVVGGREGRERGRMGRGE